MTAGTDQAALTRLQEDLLRAAFVADESAVAAWGRWREAIDWVAHLDRDAFRLLPRTYRNLQRQGVADPLLPRLKGIARQAWFANQRRLQPLQPTLQALAMSGVEVLLLWPTDVLLHDATAVLDGGVPMTCAVRASAVEAAMRCFRGTGWRSDARLPQWLLGGYVLGADRLAWRNGSTETLELLWQRDPGDRSSRFSEEVWARAGRTRLANEPVLAMDAGDALHDLCRQSVGGNAFGRIVDLLLLLDAAKAPLDWDRFCARAAQAPVDGAWRDLFDIARTLAPARVPAAAVNLWPAFVPPAPAAPPAATGSMRARIATHWSSYRQAWGGDYSFAGAVRHLPGYLLARWRLPALGHLPLRFWRGLRWEWRDSRRSR
jgi:hypothetical protein